MSKMQQWIGRLHSADSGAREQAAAELYRHGRALGDSVVSGWREDAEFASLLVGPPTVGVAVHRETFRSIREAWGHPQLARVPADQDAEEFELHAGDARLDILTTRTGGGVIARFLEKIGEGIQQVEYPVSSVDRATTILRARGVRPVYAAAREGANDTWVNFFLAVSPQGCKVLIELFEKTRSSPA